MTIVAVIFIGISLLIYVLLGGADFGAGIIEIFTGKKGINTISKAIAPVWEANHIWLIVVIVILFNAFPKVYTTVTIYLHIPILLILLGIIFRGTAFTFRYYDPFKDKSHQVYTFIFKLFSLLTPLFLGITLGAVILGRMTTQFDVTFFDQYIAPWFNLFSLSLGFFIVLLFAYLAAVYLSGESEETDQAQFKVYAKRLLFALIGMGGIVFIIAEFSGLSLLTAFRSSLIGLGSAILATISIPVFTYLLKLNNKHLTRIVAGVQVACIVIGWFAIQFPVLVALKNQESLTVSNSVAPDITLKMMIVALLVGLSLVIPLLIFLFKVFKFNDKARD